MPEPFTVLGRKLKPFSIGHEILLQRFDCNYSLMAQKAPGYADLILAVFICSRTFEEALEALQSRSLRIQMRAWGWYCGRFDYPEARSFFQRYLVAHTQWPKRFWFLQQSKGGEPGAPFVQSLKVRLQKDLGYTESGALNAPYAVALWNYLTHLENSGAIRLFNDRDAAMVDASNDPELVAKVAAIAKAVAGRGA